MGQAKDRGTKQERQSLAEERASLLSGEKYKLQMIEIKRRFRAVRHILESDIPVTGDINIDNECAFAQIRRIVEIIAFSAMIADRIHYEAQRLNEVDRRTKKPGDYTQDWNATEILQRLKNINSDFLPQSVGEPIEGPDKTKHIPFGTIGRKTHKDLISVYKNASRYLHSSNPFAADLEMRSLERERNARSTLQEDLALLRGIIWKHRKISLLPQAQPDAARSFVWVVDLLDEESDNMQIITAI